MPGADTWPSRPVFGFASVLVNLAARLVMASR
jgi:hypothetical protein